jgi:hypothetical protein
MATQDRYATRLDTRQLSTGQLVYRSLLPAAIVPDPLTDPHVLATDSVRMDVLSHNIYGDAAQWWRIASANGRADGSLYFRIGTNIVIPSA